MRALHTSEGFDEDDLSTFPFGEYSAGSTATDKNSELRTAETSTVKRGVIALLAVCAIVTLCLSVVVSVLVFGKVTRLKSEVEQTDGDGSSQRGVTETTQREAPVTNSDAPTLLVKLILVIAWDGRSAVEEAAIIDRNYGNFLQRAENVRLITSQDRQDNLMRLSELLPEHVSNASVDELPNEQEVLNELLRQLRSRAQIRNSQKDTEKELAILAVKRQEMDTILKRLEAPYPSVDSLSIEALLPKNVRILTKKPGERAFKFVNEYNRFGKLRNMLCPKSKANDKECRTG